MPGDSVHLAATHRILPDPGVRSERADRHPVVGVLLDQRRRVAGSRLHRSADHQRTDVVVGVTVLLASRTVLFVLSQPFVHTDAFPSMML